MADTIIYKSILNLIEFIKMILLIPFSFHVLLKRMYLKFREGQIEIFHLLVPSPNSHSGRV